MMPTLLMIVMHLAVIQMSNAQSFNDPTATVEHVVKPRENSAKIIFPTESWTGCGLHNVGGIGMRSTTTSASASVCTHPFDFSVKLIRNRPVVILFCEIRQVKILLNLGNSHGPLLSSTMELVEQFVVVH